MKIGAAALIYKNFEQSRHAAGSRMRKHDRAMRNCRVAVRRGMDMILFVIRTSEHPIDGIYQFDELWSLAIAWVRKIHRKIGVNMSGVTTEHNDSISENDSLFNIVSHDKNRACGDLVLKPQFEKLTAQRFCGQNVKRS